MEEKERYKIVYFDNDTRWKIIDNKTKQEVGGIDDMIKLLNQQSQRIAELEEQLKNVRKETAKKVIDRVEKLGVFDFKAYEEMDFRRYIIAEMALDNILREYGE